MGSSHRTMRMLILDIEFFAVAVILATDRKGLAHRILGKSDAVQALCDIA
jgi:hypothetical protein